MVLTVVDRVPGTGRCSATRTFQVAAGTDTVDLVFQSLGAYAVPNSDLACSSPAAETVDTIPAVPLAVAAFDGLEVHQVLGFLADLAGDTVGSGDIHPVGQLRNHDRDHWHWVWRLSCN